MSEDYVRRVPVKRIKDIDDFIEQKKKLDDLLDERQWFAKTENPLDEVAGNIKRELKHLDDIEIGSQEEKDVLKYLHNLQVKFDMIRDGSYESRLLDNIRAQTMMLDEYELRKKFPSFGRFLGALVTGNKDAKKILGYQILRERGSISQPESMEVTPNYSVLRNIANVYADSFVDIDAKELNDDADRNKELGIVPYEDVAKGFFDKKINDIGTETYKSIEQKIGGLDNSSHRTQATEKSNTGISERGEELSQTAGEGHTHRSLSNMSRQHIGEKRENDYYDEK